MDIAELIYASFHAEPGMQANDAIARADAAARRLQGEFAPATPDERDSMEACERDFLSRFTHGSAALEGSTLSPIETELVLEGEFVPSDDKALRDMFSVRGVAEGYDYALRALEEGRVLDEALVKDVHERTALDCQPRTRGTYRRSVVYIRNSLTVPVAPDGVREAMADLLFHNERSAQHPIVRTAAFHAMFENIHPFVDGNGRAGRTLLNFMLLREGYPPVAIKADGRARYLESLQAWQVDGQVEPLILMLAESVQREALARIEAIRVTRSCAQG